MYLLILLLGLLTSSILPQNNQGEIFGIVIDSSSGYPLENCNVSVMEISAGTVTDIKGKFNLILPFGAYTLKVTHLSYKTFEQKFLLSKANKTISLKIELVPASVLGREVTVTGDRNIPSTVSQEIKAKDFERMPVIYNDVLRAVQVLPGVSSNNELSSGYNVRGGNFDDNLIYLNGFEIYRPFLLRQGVEENKTLINPDLVSEFRFYNGSFPASYGDKMSSALEVNYNTSRIDSFNVYVHADFLNTGLTVKNKSGNFRYSLAARYANPGLFLGALQTDGDYNPYFLDFQFAGHYTFSEKSSAEVFVLHADNDFDLTPDNWLGGFGGYTRGDYRGLHIYYTGERTYDFKTRLYGVRYSQQFEENILFKVSLARYETKESESSDIASDFYYLPYAGNTEREYLRSGAELINNKLILISYEMLPQLQLKIKDHLFSTGVNLRLTDVKNHINEQYTETNDSLLRNYPADRFIDQKFNLDSYSAFLQDDFNIDELFFVNAGLRMNYYNYNKEVIVSPRLNIVYGLSPLHNFSLSWGYYFQPPYYAELRNKENIDVNKLSSQKAIHYSLGWEYRFKDNLKLNIEAYYRILDDIIPYYIDREKTEYLNDNSNEGYAAGFDFMVQGEIVEGMNSWLGYGYLDTKEKPKTGGPYIRRLTDQTHTIQVFLQDRIKKHPNWQSHFRLLFGSGYLFNLRELVQDAPNEQRYMRVSLTDLREYFLYFRVDMGLSASFDITAKYKLIAVAEVLNLFNHRNYGGYRFVQVSREINAPFAVPQLLSSRFLNLGLELRF